MFPLTRFHFGTGVLSHSHMGVVLGPTYLVECSECPGLHGMIFPRIFVLAASSFG